MNTTSPASSYLSTNIYSDNDDAYLLYASELHENFPCPTQLYRCVVDINRLRAQCLSAECDDEAITTAIRGIVTSIQGFRPKAWTERPEIRNAEVRKLIAEMYQTSIYLYLRLALENYMRPPITSAQRISMSRQITALVECLVATCGYHNSQAWPLTVAGAALGCSPACYQLIVDQHLLDMGSMFTPGRGTLMSLQCLRKFWASGKTGWEECFTEWQLCCF